MQGQKRATVVVDGYTRCCLTAIVVLLTVLIIGLWANGPDLAQSGLAAPRFRADATKKVPMVSATAQAQRDKIVSAIEITNQKLETLTSFLKGGKLEVVVSNLEPKDAPKP